MEKPAKLPEWASDIDALVNEPTQGKKGTGWTTTTGDTSGIPEKPSLQAFNYWMNNVYENVKYLNDKSTFNLDSPAELISNTLIPVLGGHVIVGEGGVSDDLEYIDRSPIVDGDNILLMAGDLVNPVTIKHAAAGTEDRIFTVSKEEFVLDSNNKFILLKRIGTDFYEILRSHPSNADFNPSNSLSYNIGSASRVWLEAYIETVRATTTYADTTYTDKVDTDTLNTPLNIGDTNADIINIGRTGATVAIFGDIFQVVATETVFTDKLLVLNSDSLPATAADTGFAVEEDGVQTGYIKQSPDRKSWLVKPSDGAEFDLNDKSFATIGDVKTSVLTETQFQNINGDAWEVAKGQELSRTTYASLYALIGDTYGAGDGSLTFNLPDLTEKYARGAKSDETDLGTTLDDSTAVKGLTLDGAGGVTAIAANGNTNNAGAQNINATTNVNSAGGNIACGIYEQNNGNASEYFRTGLNTNATDWPSSGNKLIFPGGNTTSNYSKSLATAANGANITIGSSAGTTYNDWRNFNVAVNGGAGNASTNVTNVGNHSHTVSVNGNVDTTHSHTLNGDTETRPKSVVLNVFIKVK